MSEFTHVLVSGRGYWGRGASIGEAINNSQWLRLGDKAFWYPCTPTTSIDEFGRIYGKVGEPTHGVIGRKAKGLPSFKANNVQP